MEKIRRKRQQFLFWEKCWTCNKWKLRSKMHWIFRKDGIEFWEARCRDCKEICGIVYVF